MSKHGGPPAGGIEQHPGNADPGLITARTLHLLSQAAIIGVCRGRMRNLIRHLDMLATNPAVHAEVRSACEALLRQWRDAQRMHFGTGSGSKAGAP